MPSRELPIEFPFGGLVKNRGYQSSSPQTTRSSLNVVPKDSMESRTRGGSRPGLIKRYSTSTLAEPLYLVRVSVGMSTRVPEFLVAGTAENVFVGKSIANGTVIPISYSEVLSPLAGEICTESGLTIMTEASENIVIDVFSIGSINRFVVTQYRGTVILGAMDVVLLTGTGTIAGTGGSTSTLDNASVPDWTVLGIDIELHQVEITSANTTVANGTYSISSVSAGSVTLSRNAFGDGVTASAVATDYTFRVGPRVIDPEVPSVDLITPTGGFIPAAADAVTVYRDRLVWAVGRTWFMSRQGDPGDYDYGADPEDPARAIAGNASEAGQPADPIIAMAASGFDYLIIFAENSTWVMRGDPGFGGQLYPASRTTGCIGSKAWCYGKETEIYFLAKDGLYGMPPNASGVQALSPDKLPEELQELDRDNFHVVLAYDPEDNGVLIFVVPRAGGTGTHYWYDISTESFWQIRFANNTNQPVDAITFGGAPTRPRRVVIASQDGFLREWSGTTDDETAIASNVVFGPFQMASDMDTEGLITELVSVIDRQSTTVTVEVYVADSAEESVQNAIAGTNPSWTSTALAGRSWKMRPRRRGVSLCVKIVAGNVWAFESLFVTLSNSGVVRRQ